MRTVLDENYQNLFLSKCLLFIYLSKSGMHNMWPVEAFNFADTAKIDGVKTYFCPSDIAKKKCWPAIRFELCTPDLNIW